MSGWPIQQTNNVILNVGTLAAAGTSQATGGVIDSSLYSVLIITGADGTVGVTLPVPVQGMDFLLYNNSASTLKVYPHLAGNVNGGSTDAAVSVLTKTFMRFTAVSTTIWAANFTPATAQGLASPAITGTVTGGATYTAPTLTTPTLTDMIISSQKYSTLIAFTSNVTLANITGLTGFTLTAGATYVVEGEIKTTMTVNGGMALAFKYTTATVTALNIGTTQHAVVVQGGYLFTTTTDQAKFIDNATAAWLINRITGTIVVGTGGTVALQAAQNTSHADTTSILAGSWLRFTRIA